MDSKLLYHRPRRTAGLIFAMGAFASIAHGAEPAPIRLSAPSLGWILAPGGTHTIEIAGVAASPRSGRSIALPSAARRSWAAPDGTGAILRLDTGIFLLRNGQAEPLTELPAAVDVSAAWDRAANGFVLCWAASCQAYAADGAVGKRWDVPPAARALAFSPRAGLVTTAGESAEWRTGANVIRLDAVPVAAAFRAATNELWSLDDAGRLLGQDAQGRRTGEGDLVEHALGLVGSLDGKSFFAANAEGAAAVFSLESGQSERLSIEDTVEGVWAAPGPFATRLHESAKRPIAIWDAESGIVGWMPAEPIISEVRQ